MIRFAAGALVPAFVSLLAVGSPVAAAGFDARPLVIPARVACGASGRCYETGDPGDRDDDDRPPPRHRYDPDDNDRPGPPPRRRYDPDDDRPSSPSRHRRYDPDDDDRPPPPPPRRRYDPDADN